jgi:hypothetical protein
MSAVSDNAAHEFVSSNTNNSEIIAPVAKPFNMLSGGGDPNDDFDAENQTKNSLAAIR